MQLFHGQVCSVLDHPNCFDHHPWLPAAAANRHRLLHSSRTEGVLPADYGVNPNRWGRKSLGTVVPHFSVWFWERWWMAEWLGTTHLARCLVRLFWTRDLQEPGKFGIWGLPPALFGVTLHTNWSFKSKETQLVEIFLRKLLEKGWASPFMWLSLQSIWAFYSHCCNRPGKRSWSTDLKTGI